MRVPEENRKDPDSVVKVVFGWPAWLLFALIMAWAGGITGDAVGTGSEVRALKLEISSLRSEVQQLQLSIDALQEPE